ncbi:MAG: hypothetical protein LBN23_01810 [Paludibacter sp.]|nr:hypothetical protein [Paludibacter sp.]
MNTKQKIICPLCGSDEVYSIRKGGWLWLILSLLVCFYPFPLFNKKYYCFDCKNEFSKIINSKFSNNN